MCVKMQAILKNSKAQEDLRVTATNTVQLFVQPRNAKDLQYPH